MDFEKRRIDPEKGKKYDDMVEELSYVVDRIAYVYNCNCGEGCLEAAAIIVASQHSREDLSHSCEIIGDESKTKIPGQKMKEYRLSHGLTQEQLAKQLGISRPYMSEIESNKRSMSVKTIKKFTDKLGITLSDFFS
ncbi:helix-turn-helix domain-containing protein [Companilactobacillus futsaii]|nr:helix-turn-helix transcriptional regulator [Companilactobacillus futsaii]KRK90911.1 hypothetical protein FC88_GL001603 [Companilactobacillus futsaii JCM 17355]